MKLMAKCLAFVSLFYQVHIKVCNPISFMKTGEIREKYRKIKRGIPAKLVIFQLHIALK